MRTVAEPELRYPGPELADGRVRLRPWEPTDLHCVQAASDEGVVPEGSTVPENFTKEAGLAWIARQHGRLQNGQGWSLAITDVGSGTAAGSVALLLRAQPGVAGIGYWLAPRQRGRGFATRAVGLVTSWALGDLGLARVEAWVEPKKRASLAVLERCGFAHDGMRRSFLSFATRRADALILSRIA